MAVVEGRLQIREWTDKEGGKRRTAEVVADNVYFAESKSSTAGQAPAAPTYSGYDSDGFRPLQDNSDDVPF